MRSLSVLPASFLLLLSSALSAAAYDDILTENLPNGLIIEHTRGPVGCTRATRVGDTISVHYKGSLLSTGAEFDESYARGKPFAFVLGAHQVIDGWDQGLLDMCIGQSRKLTIPPELGYGSRGAGADIPGGATLVFETKLMDIMGVAWEEEAEDFPPVEVTSAAEAATTAAVGMDTALLASFASVAHTTAAAAMDTAVMASFASVVQSSTEEPAFAIATAPSTPPAGNVADDKENAQPETATPVIMPSPDSSTATKNGKGDSDEDQAQCHLLGPFALLVQGALGALALLTLVWKRWRETPKRPWRIFLFDVSKQVIGSMLTHVINLAMSMLSAADLNNAAASAVAGGGVVDAEGRTPNPCSFYLLNLGIDTTLGVPILYLLLKILHALFLHTPLARPPQSIKSGAYGTPPHATWYAKQLLIYCIALVIMKLCVFFLFAALPWLPWIGDWALRWTQGNEALEITFALFIFPLAMNAVQYWVIDNFIMDRSAGSDGKEGGEYQRVGGEEDGEHGDVEEERRGMLDGEDEGVGEEDERQREAPPLKELNPTPIPSYGSAAGARSAEEDVKRR